MAYVRVTGRCLINVHTANTEGAVGNYMALSKMFIVRRTNEGYDVQEEPVISGNMIKHWHAIATTEILRSWGYNVICDSCRRHVMYRSVLGLNEEYEYLQKCAIEDLHGFLDAIKQIRRESIIKFSFMIPVEEQRSEFFSITHNRVVIDEEGKIPKGEQAMMVMKREYASGIYGFLCSMDLAFAGVSLANPDKKLPQHDRKIRARAAIVALIDLFSGHFGAAQSRATPIIKTLELICIASRRPIPNAVHGFYMDYAEETAGIVKAAINQGLVKQDEIKIVVVGRPASIFKAEQILIDETKTVSEAITKILEASDQWL
ncbi:MAG: type I-A CRISPR-associated protein Cas7/Csa2 [Ignisphaera sp.]